MRSAYGKMLVRMFDPSVNTDWEQLQAHLSAADRHLLALQEPSLMMPARPGTHSPQPGPRLVSAEEVQRARPRLLTLDDLALMPQPAYAVERYAIYGQGFNVLYGKPGAGKSLIAVDLVGMMIQAGRKVVYAALEGREGMAGRLLAWQQHHQQPLDNLRLWVDDLRMLDMSSRNEFYSELRAFGAEFVVIDTLARSMVGVNENDTTAAGLYVAELDNLRKSLNAGVLLIHHAGKMGSMRGSTVIEGAADSILKVDQDDGGGGIVVYNSLSDGGKNKDRDEAPPVYLKKVQVRISRRGEPVESVVLELNDRVIDDGTKLTSKQRQLIEVLDATGAPMTRDQLTQAGIPQSSLYRAFDGLKRAEMIEGDLSRGVRLTEKGKQAL